MLSDRLWGGSFHHHIMIIGGTTATPMSTAQLESEFRFIANPATHTTNTQAMASAALIEISCMLPAYARSLNGAVPDRTQGQSARANPAAEPDLVHKRTDS